MTSQALADWQSVRRRRLRHLFDAHAALATPDPFRRWRTRGIVWALIMRLAAEFQGFSRSLHDEAVAHLSLRCAAGDPRLHSILQVSLTHQRRLDKGNAAVHALTDDFDLLGMRFWGELEAAYPSTATEWKHVLGGLTLARNGIAHDDQTKITRAALEGWPVSRLATVQRFHTGLEGLTVGMDLIVGNYLQRLLGGSRPW